MNENDVYTLIDQEEEKLEADNPWLYELPFLEEYGDLHVRSRKKTKTTEIR